MASYEEESNFVKLDWAMPFQRTNAFPLDRTMLFSSLDDAKAYAKGLDDKKNPQDSRKLGGSAYIGQIITVYENDIVKSYVIDANRKLIEFADAAKTAESISNLSIDLSGALSTEIFERKTADTNLSNTVVNTYLSASVFEALSNEIGLSAANKENPVVTKKDIASLAGAMHFIGAATLNENEDAKVGLIRTFPKAIKGDVAIIISTSKEYVYIGDKAGQTSSWVELGDESLYATKAELSSEISNRISADSTLSTAIDNKISIDGIKTNTLSAFHINQDDFYKKVQNNEILSNELYFVSSDYINAYDEQVKNVAEPVDASDATTKNYVDTKLLSSETDFNKKISDLRKELNDSFTKNLNTLSTNLKTDYDKQISALTERLKTAETKIEELSTTVGKANEILGGIV